MKVLSAVLVLALAACSGTTATTTTAVVPPQDGPFLILYVSNQSFDDDPIGILIEIDDRIVVDEQFFVEGQHNWIEFNIALEPGTHMIEAVSSTGASYSSEFEMADTTRWAVLDYWFYRDEGSRHMTFQIQDHPIGFA